MLAYLLASLRKHKLSRRTEIDSRVMLELASNERVAAVALQNASLGSFEDML